ncbi:MAG: hypothetical protein AAGE61_03500 [Pseudomonadota bacterium]
MNGRYDRLLEMHRLAAQNGDGLIPGFYDLFRDCMLEILPECTVVEGSKAHLEKETSQANTIAPSGLEKAQSEEEPQSSHLYLVKG